MKETQITMFETMLNDLFCENEYVKIEKNKAGRITVIINNDSGCSVSTSCGKKGLGQLGKLEECLDRLADREYSTQIF